MPGAALPVTRIEPTRGFRALALKEVWAHRRLVAYLVWRDINIRHRMMALGPLWAFLRPFGGIIVYTLVFGGIAKMASDGLPYPLFLFAALLPWNFFSDAATQASSSLVANKKLIEKIYFPRLILPIISLGQAFLDFVISFACLVVLMLWFRQAPPGLPLLALPLFVLLAAMLALAVGLWLAAATALFRDVAIVMGYGLQAWFFLSPAVYSIKEVPPAWLIPFKLNPMCAVIEGFRWSLLGSGEPPDRYVAGAFLLALVLLITGAYQFRRAERSIVDVI